MAGYGSSLPSVMNHAFSRVPAPQLERSVFDRSHGYKTAFDGGELIPFLCDEILPGDTVTLQAQFFARLSSMIYPIMDNVFLDTFYFFVPARIIWENWERFNGAQDNPDDPIDYEVPSITNDGLEFTALSLADYFGLPVGVEMAATEEINALPFRAYNLIWNEWFRDENLQLSVDVPLTDGPDSAGLYNVLRRGKKHDYFTSCLPFAQKGDDVALPLAGTIPVIGNGQTITLQNGTENFGIASTDAGAGVFNTTINLSKSLDGTAVGTNYVYDPPTVNRSAGLTTNPTLSGMVANLAAATAVTINELREAIAFQQVLERDARGGTRYVEMLRAHWGVTVPDYRLQRPEYLGGSTQRVSVSAVAQTAPSPDTPTRRNVQGGLAAYATVADKSGFVKSFDEYGYLIGLVNVRADITYQQGLRKMWSRRTRFDFALPTLAHLGEQPVLNKEIYYPDLGANVDDVFGYQERYAEYRYFPSQVTGPFRSNYATSLEAWHLALEFTAMPALDASFIADNPPLDRVLAVNNEPNVMMDTYINMKHARILPVYAVPGLRRL